MASRLSMSSPSRLSPTRQPLRLRIPASVASAAPVTINLSTMSQKTATPVNTPTVAVKHVPSAAHAYTRPPLARVWREIQGANDWEDLVEPLHPLLCAEVVRYGEIVAACYKAFDFDPRSKRHLNCKYGKNRMLREVGMGDAGYAVTKYIYAAPDVAHPAGIGTCKSRWIGYVAVASNDEVNSIGRRDILVSFRGAVTGSEWVANFMSSLTPARFDPVDPRPDVKVESGFLSLYTSDDATCKFTSGCCRNQLLSEISHLIKKYKHEDLSITLTGHSMGSSLALLLGYDLAELGLNRDGSGQEVPITVYSFAGPRVGNLGFKKRCEELGVKVLRVVNVNDPVTKMPGVFLNENSRVLGGKFEPPWSCACYTHVGVELALDFFKIGDLACVHDLEAYIRVLKCPKVAQMKREGGPLISKAKKFLLEQMFETWRWRMVATRVGEILQALRI